MIIESHGVGFRKESFKKKTYHQFRDEYQFQYPFSEMTPIKREKALQETWDKLKDVEKDAPEITELEETPKKNRKQL